MRTPSIWSGCIAFVFASLTAGCRSEQAAAPPPTPPEVGVVVASSKPVKLTRILPGRLAPMRIAEVRPRVSGILVARLFEQGSVVRQGDALYRIDPRLFEVELESAKAQLARAEATLFQASRQEDRLRALLTGQTTTQAQYDIAQASEKQAEAQVAQEKAAVRRAELNLDFATVRAPIAGRIGSAIVTEGALVSPSDTSYLAVIQQLDPIYADFTQSLDELRELRRELRSGDVAPVAPNAAKVRLQFDDGHLYDESGRLLFTDAAVDPGTARVTLRGEFPNPSADLLPGTYVRVLIEEGLNTNAIAIPTQAIQRNNAGNPEVFVVNDHKRAVLQPVRIGRVTGGQTIVEDGLREGDTIVVDGFQKIATGVVVSPVAWIAPSALAP